MPMAFQLGSHGFDRTSKNGPEFNRLLVNRQFAAINPGKVDQIVEHFRHMMSLASDDSQRDQPPGRPYRDRAGRCWR